MREQPERTVMIEFSTSASIPTLVIHGDLDVAERDQFPDLAARVAGTRGGPLVVDMRGVTFMDSSGAAFLISLAIAGRSRAVETILRGADDRDLFVLEVCGALDLFTIEPRGARAPARGGAPRDPEAVAPV